MDMSSHDNTGKIDESIFVDPKYKHSLYIRQRWHALQSLVLNQIHIDQITWKIGYDIQSVYNFLFSINFLTLFSPIYAWLLHQNIYSHVEYKDNIKSNFDIMQM